MLHSLEDKGFLTVYEQEAAGKTRKYYSLTRQGRGFLGKESRKNGKSILQQ